MNTSAFQPRLVTFQLAAIKNLRSLAAIKNLRSLAGIKEPAVARGY